MIARNRITLTTPSKDAYGLSPPRQIYPRRSPLRRISDSCRDDRRRRHPSGHGRDFHDQFRLAGDGTRRRGRREDMADCEQAQVDAWSSHRARGYPRKRQWPRQAVHRQVHHQSVRIGIVVRRFLTDLGGCVVRSRMVSVHTLDRSKWASSPTSSFGNLSSLARNLRWCSSRASSRGPRYVTMLALSCPMMTVD